MTRINSFEEMPVWQASRRLVKDIYKITDRPPLNRDFGLKDQFRRSSVSVMANIAEGFERNGNKEFIQYLSNAKASVGELRSHLYIAYDLGVIERDEHNQVSDQVLSISRQLSGLMKYLSKSSAQGNKYKDRDK